MNRWNRRRHEARLRKAERIIRSVDIARWVHGEPTDFLLALASMALTLSEVRNRREVDAIFGTGHYARLMDGFPEILEGTSVQAVAQLRQAIGEQLQEASQ